jgi:hypothetical protein
MHRLIVCSSTYRQSCQYQAGNAERDPDNELWWRWQPRRLEVEAIRDSMLAVSGELARTVGGVSAPKGDEKSVRRGLYLFQNRDRPPAMQGLFDGPLAMAESCSRRNVSTVPLQSLYLLNNEFVLNRGKALAKRVLDQAGNDVARQVEVAFELTLGRPPDDADREAARQFFQTQVTRANATEGPMSVLVSFCQTLLNVNEFVYLE